MSLREVGRGGPAPEEARGAEFDMEASNARMASLGLGPSASEIASAGTDLAGGSDGTEGAAADAAAPPFAKPVLAKAAYNKSSSFFDSLSSGQGGLGRQEERRLNVETFGAVQVAGTTQHHYRGGYRGGRGGRGGGFGGRGDGGGGRGRGASGY